MRAELSLLHETHGRYTAWTAQNTAQSMETPSDGSSEVSTWHLDEIDEQLLSELNRNARVSLVALGEKVHLSRNAVRQRIERMERDGIISGYTVVRGKGAANQSLIRAYFFVYRSDRMRGGEVLSTIASIPEVVRCDILSGDFDVLVSIEAESADRVQAIWEQIASLPGVVNTVTSLTLSTPTSRPIAN